MPSLDPHYTDPVLVALYDAECGWSADRAFYAALPGPAPIRVLDIGCGTGLIAARIAQGGHDVTGVDPAGAMLDVARQRPCGDTVRWVEGFADAAQGPFDLIYMTGHAFQTLLQDTEIAGLFTTVRRLLAPMGRFVFETRNPRQDWAGRWHHRKEIEGPDGPVTLSRWVDEARADQITFTTRYHLPEGPKDSISTLRFLDLPAIRQHAARAGLDMQRTLGDWSGGAFDPIASDEIICELRLARKDPR
ncbi:class I SAM-dependent methyltransferase [Yoonia sp. R2331]|uniref:class I SAM-dependent DNA methyltransferase n=1 Tax=Yoonia sp. R2331 TaxID=3237238 RepID=UPI0034E56BFD